MTRNYESFVRYLLGPAKQDPDDQLFDLYSAIDNIVASYDDRFDAFAELLQNAVDALMQRWDETGRFDPLVRIVLNCESNELAVTDNGSGVDAELFAKVFRPNYSIKRHFRHKNARGEKGAGITFLQFAHDYYEFATKRGDFESTYRLHNGAAWFHEAEVYLTEEGDQEPPGSPQEVIDSLPDSLKPLDQGSSSRVVFGKQSTLRSLASYFGSEESSLERIEYILRTRTAVGYYSFPGATTPHPVLTKLQVECQIVLPGGRIVSRVVSPGYMFPHTTAKALGLQTALATDVKKGSQLLYEFFNPSFLRTYLGDFVARSDYDALLQKYDVHGYVSYAYQNQFYEDKLAQRYLKLPSAAGEIVSDALDLRQELTLINGGFQVFVREFPNGRRHSFLHRSGAEDKSRTFVLLNFRGPYKPDYGRKNVADDVRPFVNDLCKSLIAWLTKPERKSSLFVGKKEATAGVEDLDAARKNLEKAAERLSVQGTWLGKDATGAPAFLRAAALESEVFSEFVAYVVSGRLPGYQVHGLSAGQLDGLFDFSLKHDKKYSYSTACPLGLTFPEGERVYGSQWVEFKLSSDMLIEEFNREPSEKTKKWFSTLHLLVCESLDTATEGYSAVPIDESSVSRRKYFGVTHVLTSGKHQEHEIQVIEMRTLRGLLAVG